MCLLRHYFRDFAHIPFGSPPARVHGAIHGLRVPPRIVRLPMWTARGVTVRPSRPVKRRGRSSLGASGSPSGTAEPAGGRMPGRPQADDVDVEDGPLPSAWVNPPAPSWGHADGGPGQPRTHFSARGRGEGAGLVAIPLLPPTMRLPGAPRDERPQDLQNRWGLTQSATREAEADGCVSQWTITCVAK
jgi:hypothetical protein